MTAFAHVHRHRVARRPVLRLTSDDRAPEAFEVDFARRPDQISAAWRLVFEAYREAELIDDNPWGMHLVPHALRPSTSVVIASRGEQVISTLTIMHDSSHGLALDAAYPTELDALRQGGHKLMEVGLFADRHLPIAAATRAIVEMMRYVFYISCYSLADIVIGVHPRHAAFYERNFGFQPFTPVSTHPTVRHNAVVGLLGETQRQLSSQPVPPSLADYASRHIPRSAIKNRAAVDPQAILGSAAGQGDFHSYIASKFSRPRTEVA